MFVTVNKVKKLLVGSRDLDNAMLGKRIKKVPNSFLAEILRNPLINCKLVFVFNLSNY